MKDFGPAPAGRFTLIAMTLLVVASLVSGTGASYPQNTWLQVGPVIVFAVALPFLMRRVSLSQGGWAQVLAFLMLHLFAAHWTYSDVPYHQWLAGIGVDAREA